MKRSWALLFVIAFAAVWAARTVEIRSDVDSVLAPDPAHVNVLDTASGRGFVVALVSKNRDGRVAAAHALVKTLSSDPSIRMINAGPVVPSGLFLEWIWDHRFRLAPPAPADLSVESLTRNIANARKTLRSAEGIVAGDRLLRDPTGSFSHLMQRFSDSALELGQYGGFWESRDAKAAIIFVTFVDRPFDTQEVTALSARVRERANAEGVNALIIGPRVFSAEISKTITQESMRAGLVASGLLLAWLLWILRSRRLIVTIIIPIACGFVAACLAVQNFFGSVHVIALGFGGVLIGLALDYSLHLFAHPGAARQETSRLIMLGALTTAAGFLSMIGSGVKALMEIGVFVAVGLLVAAATCRILPTRDQAYFRALPFERFSWRFPFRASIEWAFLVGGIACVSLIPADTPRSIFQPPKKIQETIAEFSGMIALPSGRLAVVVNGSSPRDLLAKEGELKKSLDEQVSSGTIGSFTMAGSLLPATALDPEGISGFPDVSEFRQRALAALTRNGMAPDFADVQAEEYRRALLAPAVTFTDLKKFPETDSLFSRLEATGHGWRELVRLFDIRDADKLTAAIAELNVPGVQMVDLAAPYESAAFVLRRQILIWFGLGSLVAFGVLAIGHTKKSRAFGIARTTGAAVGLTVILLTLVSGPLGVFQLVSLAIVFGIGIDYGLFLQRDQSRGTLVSDYRSVGLCALSTLIAFFPFALSSVTLLHKIGTVVSLGILVTVLISTGHTSRDRS